MNPNSGKINDTIVSNNSDADKVLATLASIINDFTILYSSAKIFIQGSTPARTRRYQMGISKFWSQISMVIDVSGYENGRWEPFCKGKNYAAFIGSRKEQY